MKTPDIIDVAIIGSGLAGATTAHRLANDGFDTLVIERRDDIALEASGNPAGVFLPHLSKTLTPESRFFLSAWHEMQNHDLLDSSIVANPGGIHLAHNKNFEQRFNRILEIPEYNGIARAVNKKEASELAGMEMSFGGLFYPKAHLLSPQKLCRSCLDHSAIQVKLNCEIIDTKWDQKNKIWTSFQKNGDRIFSKYLVLAQAHETKRLTISNWLPIYTVRGQLMVLQKEFAFNDLKFHISFDGYITPALPDGRQIIGASFEHWNLKTEINPEQQQNIFSIASQKIPELTYKGWNWSDGRVSFRTTSTDRFPIVGSLPDYDFLKKRIREDRSFRHKAGLSWPQEYNIPNLYVSVAHASRGLLGCALSAKIISDLILEKKTVVNEEVLNSLGANRFLKRWYHKNKSLDIL